MSSPADSKAGADRKQSPTTTEEAPSSPSATRLAVNVSPATKAAIDRLVEREGVTQTEAVRRLIGYGDLIYRTTHVDQDEILIRRGETLERVVLI